MANYLDQPIPLSDIEEVLAWVDTFKLSRQTKKINRDFSDAVLLAEILAVHYPKLVEMHNYPPRNSQALKLNNWMTLNRKVLKKLKLTLCYTTMEMLANSRAGIIERVLINVREKIRHDEELSKSTADTETNMSSGGSYYEACGAEENVLVVPVKTRVNGVLELIQQKVVNYESYMAMKQELKDAQEAAETLRQKVEHLDNMINLKEVRIEELQNQLERKATRRKEVECLTGPFEPYVLSTPLTPIPPYDTELQAIMKPFIIKSAEQPLEEFPEINTDEPPAFPKRLSATNIEATKISVHKIESQPKISVTKIEVKPKSSIPRPEQPLKQSSLTKLDKHDSTKFDLQPKVESLTKLELGTAVEVRKSTEKPVFSTPTIEVIKAPSVKSNASTDMTVPSAEVFMMDVDRVKSDVFQEIEDEETEATQKHRPEACGEKVNADEFKDSEQEVCYQTITISDSIQKELKDIRSTLGNGEVTNPNCNKL